MTNAESAQANWNSRRSRLNHGWLGKTYPAKLGAVRNVLSGAISDVGVLARFLADDFEQWEANLPELVKLLDDFPQVMSPRMLFSRSPLAAMAAGDRHWLGDLIHTLWLARNDVEALLEESRNCLSRADQIFREIKDTVEGTEPSLRVERLTKGLNRFEAFHQACSDLSATISKFSHRLEVV